MSVTFSTAQREHIPEILKMMADFYSIDHYPFDADISRKNLSDFMDNPALGRLYVVWDNATIIGYIVLTFGFSFEYGGRDAFIDEFYLKPDHRAQGIGSKTIKFVEQAALTLEIKALHLEVENHNTKAYQLYIRQGFTENNRSLLTKKVRGTTNSGSS